MGDLIRRKDVFDLLIGEFKNDEDLYVIGRLAAGVWMIPIVEAEPVVRGERLRRIALEVMEHQKNYSEDVCHMFSKGVQALVVAIEKELAELGGGVSDEDGL